MPQKSTPDEEWLPTESDRKCYNCNAVGQIYCRLKESEDGAYTDCQYKCTSCNRTWWIDGPDA